MRALAHSAWFRPTPRRGAGGRADPRPSTRAPQPRRASGGFFGDLDVLPTPSPSAPPPPSSSSSSSPPPHVIDRPPPGVHDYYPPPPVPPTEAASPFGRLQPEHGAAHTHASTHARRARTIRVVLARPIDEHIALAPRFAPAPHCAIQEPADPNDEPGSAIGAVVTDALPFPGLAGGLVRPGDVLVRLEDPRKAPRAILDVTEASFDFIKRVVEARTPAGAVTATFARWEEDEDGEEGGEFLATRY